MTPRKLNRFQNNFKLKKQLNNILNLNIIDLGFMIFCLAY